MRAEPERRPFSSVASKSVTVPPNSPTPMYSTAKATEEWTRSAS